MGDNGRVNESVPSGRIVTVARDDKHSFSKPVDDSIELIAGRGVRGDAHYGETVQHRSRVARDPSAPNLRQVHLIHGELLDELSNRGFDVEPGQLGENILTSGVDLLSLPRGTVLALGETARIELTGLRNPCVQIDRLNAGLMKAVLGRDENGKLVRKAGVMAVVLAGGLARAGDRIRVELPAEPHLPLEPV